MIQLPQGFKIASKDVVDSRLVLSKAEMLSINVNTMPDIYFALCADDGHMYLYNIENDVDEETGRFRILEGGSGEVNVDNESISKDQIRSLFIKEEENAHD